MDLTDPNVRAKVPTGKLPSKYRRMRLLNERLAKPIVEGSDLTYGTVAHDREAAVRGKYAPEQRALDQQKAASLLQDKRITQASETEAQAIRDALASQEQVSNQTVQDMRDRQAQMVTPDGEQATDKERQAALSRTLANGSMADLTQAQGLAQSAYLRSRALTAGQREQERLTQEQRARQALGEKQSQIAESEGDFRTQYMRDAADAEQKRLLENAAFGLKETTARSLAHDRNVDNSRADASLDETKTYHDAALDAKKEALRVAAGKKDQARIEKMRDATTDEFGHLKTGLNVYDTLRHTPYKTGEKDDNNKPVTRKATPDELRSALIGKGYDDWEVNVILDMMDGSISPANAKELHSRHLRIPSRYRLPAYKPIKGNL